jgi:hypothetical protein
VKTPFIIFFAAAAAMLLMKFEIGNVMKQTPSLAPPPTTR